MDDNKNEYKNKNEYEGKKECEDNSSEENLCSPMNNTPVLGSITIVFCIVVIVLASLLYTYFDNVHFGDFWIGIVCLIPAVLALIPRSKGWVIATCVAAFLMGIASGVGVSYDGIQFVKILNIEACAVSQSQSGTPTFYGNSNFYTAAGTCLANNNNFAANSCYCASMPAGSGTCDTFQLSASSIHSNLNCGSITTTYANSYLITHVIIGALFILVALIWLTSLIFLCTYKLCCRQKKSTDEETSSCACIC